MEQAQKPSSTGKVRYGGESTTQIIWTIGHAMLIFHEGIPHLWNIPGEPTTEIKFLVFIRSRGAM